MLVPLSGTGLPLAWQRKRVPLNGLNICFAKGTPPTVVRSPPSSDDVGTLYKLDAAVWSRKPSYAAKKNVFGIPKWPQGIESGPPPATPNWFCWNGVTLERNGFRPSKFVLRRNYHRGASYWVLPDFGTTFILPAKAPPYTASPLVPCTF